MDLQPINCPQRTKVGSSFTAHTALVYWGDEILPGSQDSWVPFLALRGKHGVMGVEAGLLGFSPSCDTAACGAFPPMTRLSLAAASSLLQVSVCTVRMVVVTTASAHRDGGEGIAGLWGGEHMPSVQQITSRMDDCAGAPLSSQAVGSCHLLFLCPHSALDSPTVAGCPKLCPSPHRTSLNRIFTE